MIYLVSYDLIAPEQDYPALIDAIKSYSSYCRILKSQWLVYSTDTAEEIYLYLRKYIDENDRILVCELTANYRAWLSDDAVRWLFKNFLR